MYLDAERAADILAHHAYGRCGQTELSCIQVLHHVRCLLGVINRESLFGATPVGNLASRLERDTGMAPELEGGFGCYGSSGKCLIDCTGIEAAREAQIVAELRMNQWCFRVQGRFDLGDGGQFLEIDLYPANIFVSSPENTKVAVEEISIDLGIQVEAFKKAGKLEEAQRLEERVSHDLEMIRELGYCSGIENYSRYFDRRQPGERPFCLLDYFPNDFLMVIDESHVTIPQVRGMYGGDRSRKVNLVDYGFRLQAAIDNRPLKFEEFESLLHQTIFVSATPADFEMERSEGLIVEQVIRPTGLLDPVIEVRPSKHQIDDLMHEIQLITAKNERTLVTTLTKRMAEELQKYLDKSGVKCRYIHSDIDTGLGCRKLRRQIKRGLSP
jgi:hypothetical protein